MAKSTKTRNSSDGRSGRGLGGFIAGIIMGAALATGVLIGFFPRPPQVKDVTYRHPQTLPGASLPIPEPPFGISEDVFEVGARTYSKQCAACHGSPGQPGTKITEPRAAQFWDAGAYRNDTRYDHHPAGLIYLRTTKGMSPEMPAYEGKLSSIERWQLALLLDNADTGLPEPVMKLLTLPGTDVKRQGSR